MINTIKAALKKVFGKTEEKKEIPNIIVLPEVFEFIVEAKELKALMDEIRGFIQEDLPTLETDAEEQEYFNNPDGLPAVIKEYEIKMRSIKYAALSACLRNYYLRYKTEPNDTDLIERIDSYINCNTDEHLKHFETLKVLIPFQSAMASSVISKLKVPDYGNGSSFN